MGAVESKWFDGEFSTYAYNRNEPFFQKEMRVAVKQKSIIRDYIFRSRYGEFPVYERFQDDKLREIAICSQEEDAHLIVDLLNEFHAELEKRMR